MRLHTSKIIRLLLPLLLAAPVLLWARTALAALTITSVQPSTVTAGVGGTIAINGTDFISDTVVLLDGIGVLDTSFVGPTLVTAQVPATLPSGTYTLKVLNPDGTTATSGTLLAVLGSTATPAPTTFVRPQLVVVSYGASSPTIAGGGDYDFEMTLQNAGSETATNIVADFIEGDFLPRVTGGIRAIGSLGPGGTVRFFQPLYAVREVAQKKVASLEVKVNYTTASGQSYTDSFTLTFPVVQPSGAARPTATPTARPLLRPQLIVGAYTTEPDQLQPGYKFTLELQTQNVGNITAKRVTLIVGGGTVDLSSGTPGPGGVSGGGGSFTDFAPVGSSNVQSLGDLEPARTLSATQKLIVNAATKAGAYPLKLSFVYTDETGKTFVDDQVITVLVYQTPQVEISFYRDVGPLFVGQPNQLPIQLVNLGRNTTVLGNMRVTGSNGQFANNVLLIGPLDPGGTFPLDATVIPDVAGPLDLTVTVDYTDDFNQPQKITATLTVNVEESFVPPEGEGNGGEVPPPQPVEESLWDQ
ncbi:MAG: IPT/TIG domain-containing protein, partial [Anaerolineales bacterium]